MISQLDRALSREGPKINAPREDGVGSAKSSTVTLNAPRCPLASSDLSLCHRKIGCSRRRDGRRRFDQHGDVKVVLEQIAGFDGDLAAAADQNDAAALQHNEWYGRHGFGRHRKQCSLFRS